MAVPPTASDLPYCFTGGGANLSGSMFWRTDSKSLADTQDVDESLQRQSRSKMISILYFPVKAVRDVGMGDTASTLFAASGPFAPVNVKKPGVFGSRLGGVGGRGPWARYLGTL